MPKTSTTNVPVPLSEAEPEAVSETTQESTPTTTKPKKTPNKPCTCRLREIKKSRELPNSTRTQKGAVRALVRLIRSSSIGTAPNGAVAAGAMLMFHALLDQDTCSLLEDSVSMMRIAGRKFTVHATDVNRAAKLRYHFA